MAVKIAAKIRIPKNFEYEAEIYLNLKIPGNGIAAKIGKKSVTELFQDFFVNFTFSENVIHEW